MKGAEFAKTPGLSKSAARIGVHEPVHDKPVMFPGAGKLVAPPVKKIPSDFCDPAGMRNPRLTGRGYNPWREPGD
jgi:hypothetical protein